MTIVGAVASVLLIVLVLVDGFEAMVLPRRVTHSYRLTRFYYRGTWTLWRAVAGWWPAGRRRQAFLSLFGPLSLLGLFATWVTGLIVGFALLHASLGTALGGEPSPGFGTRLYHSGVTFFTLGYGDVVPTGRLGRFLAVAEAGIGFGFLAVIIGYLPVLYQAFSRRETAITLLDARAGSPPTAGELLRRLGHGGGAAAAEPLLAEWERWAAELLESHLSFPVLSYYRSQHDNQSWISALSTILDTCAFLLVGVKGANAYQAQLTFAMARHAAVDLALVFRTPPLAPDSDRLPPERLEQLRQTLQQAGLELRGGAGADVRLKELRELYEPFLAALARHLLFTLPPVVRVEPAVDNWQTSAWLRRSPGFGNLPGVAGDDHFD